MAGVLSVRRAFHLALHAPGLVGIGCLAVVGPQPPGGVLGGGLHFLSGASYLRLSHWRAAEPAVF